MVRLASNCTPEHFAQNSRPVILYCARFWFGGGRRCIVHVRHGKWGPVVRCERFMCKVSTQKTARSLRLPASPKYDTLSPQHLPFEHVIIGHDNTDSNTPARRSLMLCCRMRDICCILLGLFNDEASQ